MSDNKPSKPWSQQTIEERVHTHLRHQEDFVKRIDPDEQMLTHDNFLNRPVDYHIVDINRSFLTRLQSIVDNPAPQTQLAKTITITGTYQEFVEFVRMACMHETIYEDSEGRDILVIRVLDAYGMAHSWAMEHTRDNLS